MKTVSVSGITHYEIVCIICWPWTSVVSIKLSEVETHVQTLYSHQSVEDCRYQLNILEIHVFKITYSYTMHS